MDFVGVAAIYAAGGGAFDFARFGAGAVNLGYPGHYYCYIALAPLLLQLLIVLIIRLCPLLRGDGATVDQMSVVLGSCFSFSYSIFFRLCWRAASG